MGNIPMFNSITDVNGIRVGHYTDELILTGVTVILTEEGAVGGVDVKGGAPGTRETDLLSPLGAIEEVNCITLCGGSAFGLDAVSGVMRFLEEEGIGYRTGNGKTVSIVPSAVLYDLGRGEKTGRMKEEAGYRACAEAKGGKVCKGNVGAGTGAVSGGLKGGVGTASECLNDGITLGAIAAVNSWGSTVDLDTGGFYARHLELDEEFGDLRKDTPARRFQYARLTAERGQHTTLGVVATNARLTKAEVNKLAQMANDGLARAVYPVHSMLDGDVVFALATGKEEIAVHNENSHQDRAISISILGAHCADALARAIVHAILEAETVGKYLCYKDKYNQNFPRRLDA